MGSRRYSARFEEPDGAGKYHLQLELRKQNSLEEISGRAFKLLASEAEQATSLAGNIQPTNIGAEEFALLFRHIQTIYRINLGLRNRILGRSVRDSVSTGRLDCNIDSLVRDVSPFEPEQYTIAPGENHRDSLNRIKVLNIIYTSLFRQMSSDIASSYQAATNIRECSNTYGHLAATQELVEQLTHSISGITNQVENAKKLLLKKDTKLAEYASIVTIIKDSVRIAKNYLKHIKGVGEPEIEITVSRLPRELYVVGDSGEIMQALITLLVDKKYVLKKTENPKVEIMCGSNDGLAFVYLRDNGPNIRFRRESMIFDMAYIEPPHERCVDIAAALEIIYRNGATLDVANMHFGKGVEMKIQMIQH